MWITGIIITFLIIVGSFIYKNNIDDLKHRCTTTSAQYIFTCMERGDKYPQEQYDYYYNIAANNPSISVITDKMFYQGFSFAYNNCGPDSKPSPCNLHDKNVMANITKKCAFNINDSLFCARNYFLIEPPNDINIGLFTKIAQYEIQKNKEQSVPTSWYCNDSFKIFYKKIPSEKKINIPLEIQKSCAFQGKTYTKNGIVIYY